MSNSYSHDAAKYLDERWLSDDSTIFATRATNTSGTSDSSPRPPHARAVTQPKLLYFPSRDGWQTSLARQPSLSSSSTCTMSLSMSNSRLAASGIGSSNGWSSSGSSSGWSSSGSSSGSSSTITHCSASTDPFHDGYCTCEASSLNSSQHFSSSPDVEISARGRPSTTNTMLRRGLSTWSVPLPLQSMSESPPHEHSQALQTRQT